MVCFCQLGGRNAALDPRLLDWVAAPAIPEASGSFLVGMIVFVVLLVFESLDTGTAAGTLAGELNHLTVVFFVVGLTTLPLVHGHWSSHAAGRRHSMSLAWLLAITLPVGSILLIGLAVTEGLTAVGQSILRSAYSIVLVFWRLALILWRALLWVIFWVNRLLHWISGWSSGSEDVVGNKGAQPFTLAPDSSLSFSSDFLRITSLHPGIVAGGMIAVLFLILSYLVLRRGPKTERREQTSDERTSQWSWKFFAAQILGLWFVLFGRMLSQAVSPDASGSAVVHDTAGLTEMRRLYVRLLDWAAESGQARRASQTPIEFGRELAGIEPSVASDIETITASYADARYGDRAIHGSTLEAARKAVGQLNNLEELLPSSPLVRRSREERRRR
jgi:Domain of unknown function (DUF4129)